LTHWHEQVFVFDDETVVFASDREEARVPAVRLWRDDKGVAQQVQAGLKTHFSNTHSVGKETLQEMRLFVINNPALLETGSVGFRFREWDLIKLDESDAFDSDSVLELRITTPLEELALRDIAIEEFARGLGTAELNSLGGSRFESPQLSWIEPAQLLEAARRDVERIKKMSIHILGVGDRLVGEEAIVTPFVHQSWCEWLKKAVISHGLQGQLFSELGKLLIQFEVAMHFTAQLPYDLASAGPASVATHGVIPSLWII
jgi:hypothetical protein